MYVRQQMRIILAIFFYLSQSKKKYTETCKLSLGIGFRQDCWEPDLRPYPVGSFH